MPDIVGRGPYSQLVKLAASSPCVVATGAELKNTLCITRGSDAFLSPCFGDLGLLENLVAARTSYASLMEHLEVRPMAAACDMHPDFQSSRLAEDIALQYEIPLFRIQHHHAHIAAVMAEYGLDGPVIGLALDGSGYGTDGTSWGGECLQVDQAGMQRVGRLRPASLPGNDVASREPWRMATAYLFEGMGSQAEDILKKLFPDEERIAAVLQICSSRLCRKTSSAGRLFDAAAAIILGHTINAHEADAAVKLEATAGAAVHDKPYDFEVFRRDGMWELDFSETLCAIADEKLRGTPPGEMAGNFHATLANGLAQLVSKAVDQAGVPDVVLSGGCMANRLLSRLLKERLAVYGYRVWLPEILSPGDTAISLGQAWVVQKSWLELIGY